MSSVKFTTIKSEENGFNSFLADEYQVGDQVKATIIIDGKEFCGMGCTKRDATDDLHDRINAHYNAKIHTAKVEINKARGQYFFD